MYIPVTAKSSAMINGNYEDRTKTIVKNFPIVKQGNRVTINMNKRDYIIFLIALELMCCLRYYHSKPELQ